MCVPAPRPATDARRNRSPRPRRFAAPLLVAALLLPVAAAGQEAAGAPGQVFGRVVDAFRLTPVPAARVMLPALDRETLAGEGGWFRFRDVPPGTHEVRVEFLGYEATVGEVQVRPGGRHRVEIRTKPGPVELEDLEVSVRSLTWLPGFRKRRENRTGHFFAKHEIEEADPDHLTDLLRGAEGVKIGMDQTGHGPTRFYPQFYDRGPREGMFCRPPVFVDGSLMGPGRPYWRFNEIPPDRVLAMEVYYRERDIPEAIEYDARGRLRDVGPALTELASPASRRTRLREILSAAGADGVIDQEVPQRDGELSLAATTLVGLYDRSPRLEHCGAIFVWTRLYPHRDG